MSYTALRRLMNGVVLYPLARDFFDGFGAETAAFPVGY